VINSLSIIIPALNEEESIKELIEEINLEFKKVNCNLEIIVVDDFSNKELTNFISKKENLKIIRNTSRLGQYGSTLKGADEASNDFICIIDGDGQNPPKEIIKLLNLYNKNFGDVDVVAGIRRKRKDNLIRKNYSKFANFLIRKLLGSKMIDLGCSLKIFNKHLLEELRFSGDIHRILLLLFEKRGLRIIQEEVEHRERIYGKTNYGFGRIIPVFVDSLILLITSGMKTTPRYVLGKISTFFLGISLISFCISLYQKYFLETFVHRNPIFLLGITFLFISVQLFITTIITFFIENKNNQ
jgi:glycosyltransferase involved in cell wall biosynthesis